VIVAYRNVTPEMLASADTIVATDGSAPSAETTIFRKMRVRESSALTRTSRIVVVLLEDSDMDGQIDSLRRMVTQAKAIPESVGPASMHQFADSLEWIEGPQEE
jgi:hypothetical protein